MLTIDSLPSPMLVGTSPVPQLTATDALSHHHHPHCNSSPLHWRPTSTHTTTHTHPHRSPSLKADGDPSSQVGGRGWTTAASPRSITPVHPSHFPRPQSRVKPPPSPGHFSAPRMASPTPSRVVKVPPSLLPTSNFKIIFPVPARSFLPPHITSVFPSILFYFFFLFVLSISLLSLTILTEDVGFSFTRLA